MHPLHGFYPTELQASAQEKDDDTGSKGFDLDDTFSTSKQALKFCVNQWRIQRKSK